MKKVAKSKKYWDLDKLKSILKENFDENLYKQYEKNVLYTDSYKIETGKKEIENV